MNNAPSLNPSGSRTRRKCKPAAQAEVTGTLDCWVGEFDHHLSQVVGLAHTTRREYLFFVRRFLAQYCLEADYERWAPRAEWLTAFVGQEAERLHGHSRKKAGTALRAWLRYLVFCGKAGRELEAAIPSMPQWKYASLPVYLTAEQTERVLGAALDGSAHELRNRAMLLVLARMGVRAGELRHLMLDDIDWIEGCVRIRPGKSHRERRLPLPHDAGEALCAYLQRGRPSSPCRAVFLSTKEPYGPILDSSVVSRMVRRAMYRAGVEGIPAAAHALRHTAATQMVCRGASFKEVADVLGHVSLGTTAIYAKLDLATLAHVALPWPGVRS
ncbi:site-specific integrase [Paraburkholderia sp. EG286B]|uniref:site-specific integrase n=1 Tax=Paraburkholderia sp. EG286B TaxID=3237011 RepID=UPI0034D226BF